MGILATTERESFIMTDRNIYLAMMVEGHPWAGDSYKNEYIV
jgi:hypothetical protein